MSSTYTAEQILALAPDPASAKAGQGLATARKWVTLGSSEQALWGECQGSGSKPYQTQIDLSEPAFKCSCPSRKFPCKHGLGLFLLFQAQGESWTHHEAPTWVSEWLQSRAEKAEKRVEKAQKPAETTDKKAVDPKAQAKRIESREANVRRGLQELELWLHDLLRGGLAQLSGRNYQFWENIAKRMVDAQAPGLARMLRDMAGIPASGPGWQDDLLRRLGRLHLAIEGYKRLDTLPPDTQADLRTLVGWTQNAEELMAQAGVRDHWFVAGQTVEEEEMLRVQRTWLWGQNSRRSALALSFAFSSRPFDLQIAPGCVLDAEIVFYPGAVPLRAAVKERFGVQPWQNFDGGGSISHGVRQMADALSRNPWLETLPLALSGVRVVPGEHWSVRDGDGVELPLPEKYAQGWSALALSGGEPLTVFGDWNGHKLRPHGATFGTRWIRL
jgi:hypothetical protein